MRYFILTVFFLVTVFAAQAQKPYAEGELMIQLNHKQYSIQDGVTALEQDYQHVSLQQVKKLSRKMKIHLFSFDKEWDEHQLLEEIKKHPAVSEAQFNHRVELRSATEDTIPDDPYFDDLWGLHNTGQTGGIEDADIDAPEAWMHTPGGVTALGDTVVVAVVDGGVATQHEDLIDNMWVNEAEIPDNDIDDDENGYVDDIYGWNAYSSTGSIPGDSHGTHVAGTVSARGGNGIGVSGVNWYAKIMAIAASSGFESTVVEGYSYVLDMRTLYNETDGEEGAFVVATNASFGVDQGDPDDYPLWGAIYDSLGQQGVLSAAATANASWDIDEVGDVPTAFESPYLLSVTNTNDQDQKAFAGYGLNTIDLGAPGSSIYSTTPNDNYGYKTGTSMATPHVTGALAFLFSAADSAMMEAYKTAPDSIALLIKDYMMFNVDPLPALEGITVSGGRLNINNAVMAMDTIPVGPELLVSQDSLEMLLMPGQSDTLSFVVSNAGGGTVNYTASVPDTISWIEIDNEPGTLYENQSDSLQLIINTEELENGDHYGEFFVMSQQDTSKVVVEITVGLDTGEESFVQNRETTLKAGPNPFSQEVRFNLFVPQQMQTTLRVYDLSGKQVAGLLDRNIRGEHTLTWDGVSDAGKVLPDGVYIIRLANDSNILTKKIVLQR
ncbi:MAG: S8 family serine peptidase [Bacteroidota bacterium]